MNFWQDLINKLRQAIYEIIRPYKWLAAFLRLFSGISLTSVF